MFTTLQVESGAIQVYEPDPEILYSIDDVQHLLHLPRRQILIYYKYGLVSPVVDPECGGYFFNDEAIRALRRIKYLRFKQGVNLSGIKIILGLMNEVEKCRADVAPNIESPRRSTYVGRLV